MNPRLSHSLFSDGHWYTTFPRWKYSAMALTAYEMLCIIYCVYIYIYIYIYIYTHTNTLTHTHIHVYMYTKQTHSPFFFFYQEHNTQPCTHSNLLTQPHTHTHTHEHTHTHTHPLTYSSTLFLVRSSTNGCTIYSTLIRSLDRTTAGGAGGRWRGHEWGGGGREWG